MAYSFAQYPGDGSNRIFTVPFPYISQSHVVVSVDGTQTTAFTWPSSSSIQMNVAPGIGAVVDIRRNSNRSSRIVDFQDASLLTEEILDQDSNQVFYVAQEAFDSADAAVPAAAQAVASAVASALSETNAGASAASALASKNAVDTAKASVDVTAASFNDANIVHKAGTETITGQKTFSLSPAVPTEAVDNSTTSAASTAFVIGQAASAAPADPAAASAVGTSKRYARQDHVHKHPSQLSTASGSAPSYGCRAWCTSNPSTATIVAQGNVASCVRNGVGDYTFTFSTAMPDANYSVQAMINGAGLPSPVVTITSKTTTTVRFSTGGVSAGSAASGDATTLDFAIYR